MTYKVNGNMTSVRIVAFCVRNQIADLQLQADDAPLQPKRIERQLPSPPGGAAGGQKRTMIEYDCTLPSGHSQIKLLWTGNAELDRVEIYYR
jgi:hypothetical protein